MFAYPKKLIEVQVIDLLLVDTWVNNKHLSTGTEENS